MQITFLKHNVNNRYLFLQQKLSLNFRIIIENIYFFASQQTL